MQRVSHGRFASAGYGEVRTMPQVREQVEVSLLKWPKFTDDSSPVVQVLSIVQINERLPTKRSAEGTLVGLAAEQEQSDAVINVQFDAQFGQQTPQRQPLSQETVGLDKQWCSN